MPIITFWSNEKNETAQTLSMAAVATYMAIEHNYKILILSTKNNDKTLEECFWNLNKSTNLIKEIAGNKKVALDSGIDGLIKIIASNKTSPEIITNYTRIVFKDRLDVLFSTETNTEQEYAQIKKVYPEVLKTASQYYDLVFVDLNKGLDEEYNREILEMSDVIIANLTQRLKLINEFAKLREEEQFLSKRNIMLLLGRYDKFSKYSAKNITRFYHMKKEPGVVPYNTLFFEACSEGKIADFFLRMRNLDKLDRNAIFIDEVKKIAESIVYKLQELQTRI